MTSQSHWWWQVEPSLNLLGHPSVEPWSLHFVSRNNPPPILQCSTPTLDNLDKLLRLNPLGHPSVDYGSHCLVDCPHLPMTTQLNWPNTVPAPLVMMVKKVFWKDERDVRLSLISRNMYVCKTQRIYTTHTQPQNLTKSKSQNLCFKWERVSLKV